MQRLRNLAAAAVLLPAAAVAAPDAPVPAEAQWYIHANLLEMRQTSSGQSLYGWLEREVLEDINDELGVKFVDELDGVTVFGAKKPDHENAAVILHGFLSQKTRNELLDRASEEMNVSTEEEYGRTFHRMGGSWSKSANVDVDFDGGYLAFGDQGQTMVTSDRDMLDQFLAADSHFEGAASNSLLTIQADRALVHGGVDTVGVGEGGPWDSQMFQNVERMALVVADNNGLLDIQVYVTATDPTMAQAISNIIQGMVSLKVLADEEPQAAAILENLVISTEGADVRMQLMLDPEFVMDVID
ncbi:MAG: hypothetical protein AAGE01_16760 [Pseudomonadota bacterium]